MTLWHGYINHPMKQWFSSTVVEVSGKVSAQTSMLASFIFVSKICPKWQKCDDIWKDLGLVSHRGKKIMTRFMLTWWRHQRETFPALLAICAGNSPVPDEFPSHRSVTRSFDVFFDPRPKRLSKQSWGWWFETPSRPFLRHHNDSEIW